MQDIFKISIHNQDLNYLKKEQLILTIKKIKNNKGRYLSNFTGYQSYDLKIKEFKDLIKCVELEANKYSKELGISKKLTVCNFWLNINKYKDSNVVHNHPDSILSGVYYVNVPEKSGRIVFRNPTISYLGSFWPDKIMSIFNNNNSSLWKIDPKDDLLLIFPSWL